MQRYCEVCDEPVFTPEDPEKGTLVICSVECQILITVFEHTHRDNQYHKVNLDQWLHGTSAH